MACSKAVFDIVHMFDPDGSSRPGPGEDGNPEDIDLHRICVRSVCTFLSGGKWKQLPLLALEALEGQVAR